MGRLADCAWLVDNAVFCWGQQAGGFVGDGEPIGDPEKRARPYPVAVQGLSAFLSSVGEGFATLTDGGVQLWTSTLWPLDGTASLYEYRTRVELWPRAPAATAQLAPGYGFTCVRSTRGEVRCAGSNAAGTLGDGTVRSRDTFGTVMLDGPARDIAARSERACAVVKEHVVCWGLDRAAPEDSAGHDCVDEHRPAPATPPSSPAPHQVLGPCDPLPHVVRIPEVIAGVEHAIDVELGDDFGCALDVAGEVSCWGQNDRHQLGDGTLTNRPRARPVTGVHGAVQLSVGSTEACVRDAVGNIDCWGGGKASVLRVPDVHDAVDVGTADARQCVVRRRDGNVWCRGHLAFGDGVDSTVFVPLPWAK